jgi:outer membrane protein assembly factor BamB
MSGSRALLLAVLLAAPASAGDWPQWLGPHRDGTTREKVAPWKRAPKVLWRRAVTDGHSSPVVVGNRVFLHTKVKDKDAEQLTAYDAKTGEPVWQKSYPRGKFFSIFGVGPQAKSGKRLWQVDTQKKFSAPKLFFGVACSPLVEDGKVMVNVGGKGSGVVAFDAKTGTVAWQKLDATASYSSPIAVGKGKDRQVIFLTQQGLASLSPGGDVFWTYPLVDKLDENATTPTTADGLLVAGSIKSGSVGLEMKEADGKPAVSRQWKNAKLTCYFSTPVPVGEYLYLVTGKPTIVNPSADLHCVQTKTGKVVWTKEGIGQYHGALTRTGDDKLLLFTDLGGLILLDPNPKGYKELATSKVSGKAWAHPALSNGRLYLRDEKELICLELGPGE